jgi:hypothetical protein
MFIHSRGGLILRRSLAESLRIFRDLAMGETEATEAQRRWNAEGAGIPPPQGQIIGKTRGADLNIFFRHK